MNRRGSRGGAGGLGSRLVPPASAQPARSGVRRSARFAGFDWLVPPAPEALLGGFLATRRSIASSVPLRVAGQRVRLRPRCYCSSPGSGRRHGGVGGMGRIPAAFGGQEQGTATAMAGGAAGAAGETAEAADSIMVLSRIGFSREGRSRLPRRDRAGFSRRVLVRRSIAANTASSASMIFTAMPAGRSIPFADLANPDDARPRRAAQGAGSPATLISGESRLPTSGGSADRTKMPVVGRGWRASASRELRPRRLRNASSGRRMRSGTLADTVGRRAWSDATLPCRTARPPRRTKT